MAPSPERRRRIDLLSKLGALLVLLSGAGSLSIFAESAYAGTPTSVKAAFIYSFARFTTWPESAVASTSLLICVYGGDRSYIDNLEQLVARKKVGNRWLEIKAVTDAKITSCQIIFFPLAERSRTAAAISKLNHAGILLIGEDPDFLKDGGMINLVVDGDKVAFEINRTATEAAKLQLNSSLFTLARNIYSDGHANAR